MVDSHIEREGFNIIYYYIDNVIESKTLLLYINYLTHFPLPCIALKFYSEIVYYDRHHNYTNEETCYKDFLLLKDLFEEYLT